MNEEINRYQGKKRGFLRGDMPSNLLKMNRGKQKRSPNDNNFYTNLILNLAKIFIIKAQIYEDKKFAI